MPIQVPSYPNSELKGLDRHQGGAAEKSAEGLPCLKTPRGREAPAWPSCPAAYPYSCFTSKTKLKSLPPRAGEGRAGG